MPQPHDILACPITVAGYNKTSHPLPEVATLATIARDQFCVARNAGDRRTMTFWSARENALRRAAYGALASCGSVRTTRHPLRARSA